MLETLETVAKIIDQYGLSAIVAALFAFVLVMWRAHVKLTQQYHDSIMEITGVLVRLDEFVRGRKP